MATKAQAKKSDEAQKNEEITLTIKIGTSKFLISDAYDMRQQCQKDAEVSLKIWENLDEDYRHVLEEIVKRSIESLHANTSRWLPHCMIDGVGGDKIEIRIAVLLSDVEAQVDMLVDATDFEVENTRRKLKELFEETAPVPNDDFLKYVQRHLDNGLRLSLTDTERLMEMVK